MECSTSVGEVLRMFLLSLWGTENVLAEFVSCWECSSLVGEAKGVF